MNRVRLYLHRIFRRPAVTGPYRLYVRRVPAGAMLDVEHYLDSMLVTLADNPDLLDLLLQLADDRGQARQHDGWEPEGLLVENIKAALGFEIPLYGPAAKRLADQLSSHAPVAPVTVIPRQRREGGAAA
ncbi:hypothetical protein [Streptomyces sp. NPDC059753]|uniref:hypothetical protein n=1 Tax=Streptomyces sp. NPDC059753 TaxID=3346933 RepID=UPI00364B7139